MRIHYAAGLSLAALALSLCCAGAQAPDAQARPGRSAGRQAGIDLATIPPKALDYVVTLTTDQQSRIAAIQGKFAADERALRPARGAAPDPSATQKRAELRRQASRDVLDVLTDTQRARLRGATPWLAPLRTAGIPLATLPDLKPTREQQDKLAAIRAEAQGKMRALPRTLTPAERREKARPIMEDVRAQVTALLTADQKAVIEKYRQEHRRVRRNRGA